MVLGGRCTWAMRRDKIITPHVRRPHKFHVCVADTVMLDVKENTNALGGQVVWNQGLL